MSVRLFLQYISSARIVLMLLLVSASLLVAQPSFAQDSRLATGRFFVSESQIIDPEGKVFYPFGFNVNGPESWDSFRPNLQTIGHSDDALAWNVNTIRLTSCYGQGDRNGGNFPDDDFDAIVKEYTAKGIVVMAEGRYDCSQSGQPPTESQLTAIRTEFTKLAETYKNNPYVWFNLLNEPTQRNNDESHDIWKSIHVDIATAIRTTGNTNIIVVDGSNFAQENHWSNGYEIIDSEDSAILKYGADVQTAATCNVLFSLHVYTEWKSGSDTLAKYIDSVHDNNMALIIGEVGRSEDAQSVQNNLGATLEDHHASSAAVYDAAPQKGVGVLAWHGAGGDDMQLVEPLNGEFLAYWQKDNADSNLTPFGQLHWNLANNLPSSSTSNTASAPPCLDGLDTVALPVADQTSAPNDDDKEIAGPIDSGGSATDTTSSSSGFVVGLLAGVGAVGLLLAAIKFLIRKKSDNNAADTKVGSSTKDIETAVVERSSEAETPKDTDSVASVRSDVEEVAKKSPTSHVARVIKESSGGAAVATVAASGVAKAEELMTVESYDLPDYDHAKDTSSNQPKNEMEENFANTESVPAMQKRSSGQFAHTIHAGGPKSIPTRSRKDVTAMPREHFPEIKSESKGIRKIDSETSVESGSRRTIDPISKDLKSNNS